MIVLSLGAGVQSTTIALLAIDGVLPHIDHAIFADTGWEPADVYAHLDRLTPVLEAAGTQVHRVSAGNLRADTLTPGSHYAAIPMYVIGADGADGIGRRQCTERYKLRPIKAKVRELLGAPIIDGRVGRIHRGHVEHWVGISADEAARIKPSDVRYMRRRDPLVDLLPTPWTRAACRTYLADRWPYPVARSACIACPYHSNAEWRRLRDEHPDEWADAVDFDHAVRTEPVRIHLGMRGTSYLHRDRVPLDEADIDTPDRAPAAPTLFDEPIGCSPYDCHAL